MKWSGYFNLWSGYFIHNVCKWMTAATLSRSINTHNNKNNTHTQYINRITINIVPPPFKRAILLERQYLVIPHILSHELMDLSTGRLKEYKVLPNIEALIK